MAGQQWATPRGGVRRPKANPIDIGSGETWYSFDGAPQYDFSPLGHNKGSVEGVVEGMSRISGKVINDWLPDEVASSVIDMSDFRSEIEKERSKFLNQGRKGLAGRGIGYGRMSSADIAVIEEYVRRGLWADEEAKGQMEAAKKSLMREANEKRKADEGKDMFRMLGNAVMPHLDDRAVAKDLILYRGDVVPLELAARSRVGAAYHPYDERFIPNPMSYSLEPFQAYRYTQFNKDGRREKAMSASPSGRAAKRIIEVRMPEGALAPVLNPDYAEKGTSELLYPSVDWKLALKERQQVYNASDPGVPLIWDVYE